ncbi:MAG TPA: hypothetical protein VFH95_06280 [Candidatus Kapabacteria bacterium]|nr:hypothetical protein [Candidatus Kapabacteria bacterium]
MLVNLTSLPDHSRIWIFPASRRLSESESTELLSTLDTYLAHWEAHHVPVQAARELHFNQFLIIAANPDVTAPSGCSIDDMTRAIKSLGAKFGVDFFGAMKIFYRDGEEIRMVTRSQFKQLAESGAVDAETMVFDNSLTSLGELRAGKWEIPVAASWQSALLPEVLAL